MTQTLDWSRFYFPEVLPALDSAGELRPDLEHNEEPDVSKNPKNQPEQELRWATLRSAALDNPDFQKFLGDLIQKDTYSSNEERYQKLLNYQLKGMSRFPSLKGYDWDMYKVRTTLCLLYLEAAGYITKKEYIK